MPTTKKNPHEDDERQWPSEKEIRADLEKITKIVMGNGDPDKSLVVKVDRLENTIKDHTIDNLHIRLDRLEVSAKKRDFYLKTMGAAVIGLIFTAIAGLVKSHLH